MLLCLHHHPGVCLYKAQDGWTYTFTQLYLHMLEPLCPLGFSQTARKTGLEGSSQGHLVLL